MTEPAASPPDATSRRLAPLFLAIVVVEAVTVAALYWFGRHFS
jgi:hypothetical protein